MSDHPDAIFTEEQRRAWVERKMMQDGVIPSRPLCQCERCQLAHHFTVALMPVCPQCGSKRCSGAYDHRMPCMEKT